MNAYDKVNQGKAIHKETCMLFSAHIFKSSLMMLTLYHLFP